MDHLEIPAPYLAGQSKGGWTCLSFAATFAERLVRA
jgi:hypothetical protein